MARPTKFQKASRNIEKFFDASPKKVFSYNELSKILESHKATWDLPNSMFTQGFVDGLCEYISFREIVISFSITGPIKRYIYKNPSAYHVLSYIRNRSYLSHYTASYLSGMTEQFPKTIYITLEQSKKTKGDAKLSQEGIDIAFSKPQRESNDFAEYDGYRAIVHNGKQTNNFGVIENTNQLTGERIRITNDERTLIDIMVRPNYAGGVNEVMKCFNESVNRISVNRLMAVLNNMDYLYPYSQVLGFYLDKTGKYESKQLEFLRRKMTSLKMYLTYQIKDVNFSDTWNVFYPKDF